MKIPQISNWISNAIINKFQEKKKEKLKTNLYPSLYLLSVISLVGSIRYILSGLYYQEIKNKTKNKLQKQKGISRKLKTYQIRNDYEMTALHGVV